MPVNGWSSEVIIILQDIQHTEMFCIVVGEICFRENNVEMNSIKRPAFVLALHLCVHDIISNTETS